LINTHTGIVHKKVFPANINVVFTFYVASGRGLERTVLSAYQRDRESQLAILVVLVTI
jgi:hypothetical protein